MKKIIGWFILSFAISVVSLNANARVSPLKSDHSMYSCKDAVGHWEGKGTANMGFMTCDYSGYGDVTHIVNENYKATLYLKRESGGFACAAELNLELEGTCIDNFALLKDARATLSGILENGFMHAEGKMSSPKADLTMDIYQK